MTKTSRSIEERNNVFIRSIRLRNLLSFGPDSEEIELQPLNVLIGPNASGKSNFIAAISLLKAAPRDLLGTLRQMGGLENLVWKGDKARDGIRVQASVSYPRGDSDLRYALRFEPLLTDPEWWDESVAEAEAANDRDHGHSFYWRSVDEAHIRIRTDDKSPLGSAAGRGEKVLSPSDFSGRQSILCQRRDPDAYPEITYLAEELKEIRIFSEWRLGPQSPARMPQRTDLPGDFLLEDASNLARMIDSFRFKKGLREDIHKHLGKFADHMNEVTTKMDFGTASVYIQEWDGRMIPATQLSDGTLRYLCLLVILCHPEPPPLICIEEPELDLHPDIIGEIADLLVEASKRTQLIVTTHSEILVSALSETPESILVCEQDAGGTKMRRLSLDKLKEWLKEYSLGDLWAMGEIGGSRW
ncbi:MAG TPA: AAA family ATPase [bacterium]|nr:AAA family ATPase [bacterium]